jgi:hypothetical protein
MAHTKSQLPMIRSLKAIARRKANISYYDIEIPSDVKTRLKNQVLSAKRERARALRALLRGQTKTLLVALALEKLCVTLRPEEQAELQAYKVTREQVEDAAGGIDLHETERNWQREQLQEAKDLFNELEAIELNVISGETVDLAPYANRLKS